jgi:hypothetical protein
MTTPPDDYKVGHCRTPVETRWPKGRSGNPRTKPKAPESLVAMTDRLLLSPVKLTLNGEVHTVAALVAIISQLQLKAMAGSTQASKILLKYRAFANQHAERQFKVIFKDTEETTATATAVPESDRG